MQIECPACRRIHRYDDERPTFCSACGARLEQPALAETHAYTPPVRQDSGVEGTVAFTPAPAHESAGYTRGDQLNDLVGGYRLLRRLGRGGMGSCFEAEQLGSNRRVALKLIAPEYARSPEALERFRQEGRLASLLEHPRCVFVMAADEAEGRPYIAMELMTGQNLEDLVRKQGPLEPVDAIRKALDVLEGLAEVHRLGLVHRDVKPSNCFLEPDGRVKIGDFGLSKSLLVSTNLTQTGRFLGTPQYASPEQVRGDKLDARTDVYSAAAVLYFLLSGRPPHQQEDAAAMLARIVSEPPESLRKLRPGLSGALDRVVLRALDRRPERRFQSAEDFRARLLTLVPGQLSASGLALRFGAYMTDVLFLWSLPLLLRLAMPMSANVGTELAWATLGILYWAVSEGRWGCSPAKYLFRLRVQAADAAHPPGLPKSLVRATLLNLAYLFPILFRALDMRPLGPVFFYAWFALPLVSMRKANGFRGLHELISGTRTVQLPWPARRRVLKIDSPLDHLPADPGLPQQCGGFVVRGALRGDPQLLVGEDLGLGRRVILWRRAGNGPVLSAARRDLVRPGRLRWLAAGCEEGYAWDAFLAPSGSPLDAQVAAAGRLAWSEARPVLEQLADELDASLADSTRPVRLAPSEVWVADSGRTQFCGLGTQVLAADFGAPAEAAEQQALATLRDAAVVALEGRPREAGPSWPDIRAPLPLHATESMTRLLDPARGFQSVRQFRHSLHRTREMPTAVERQLRASQLWLAGPLLALGLLLAYVVVLFGHFAHLAVLNENMTKRHEVRALIADQDAGLARLRELEGPGLDELATMSLGAAASGEQSGAQRLSGNRAILAGLERRDAEDGELWVRRQRAYGWLGDGSHPPVYEPPSQLERRDRFADVQFGDLAWAIDDLRLPYEGPFTWYYIAVLETPALLAMLTAAIWRGGLTLWLFGIVPVMSNGRIAPRLVCAGRALLVWALPVSLLALSATISNAYPAWLEWCLPLEIAAAVVAAAYLPLALISPARSLHDRLTGVWLVPR
ncbi:MAG: protein kinase [Pirellulales bacterium]